MKNKRTPPAVTAIDPELKNHAQMQLIEEIALIEHWVNSTRRKLKTDVNAAELHSKYKDMLRSRQDMLDALQKQHR